MCLRRTVSVGVQGRPLLFGVFSCGAPDEESKARVPPGHEDTDRLDAPGTRQQFDEADVRTHAKKEDSQVSAYTRC